MRNSRALGDEARDIFRVARRKGNSFRETAHTRGLSLSPAATPRLSVRSLIPQIANTACNGNPDRVICVFARSGVGPRRICECGADGSEGASGGYDRPSDTGRGCLGVFSEFCFALELERVIKDFDRRGPRAWRSQRLEE